MKPSHFGLGFQANKVNWRAVIALASLAAIVLMVLALMLR